MLINDEGRFAGPQPTSGRAKGTANLFTYVYNDPINNIDPSGQQTQFPVHVPFGGFFTGFGPIPALDDRERRFLELDPTEVKRRTLLEMHRGVIADLGVFKAQKQARWIMGAKLTEGWAIVEDVTYKNENFKIVWSLGPAQMNDRPSAEVKRIIALPAGPEHDQEAAQVWFDYRSSDLKMAGVQTAIQVAVLALPELLSLRAARGAASAVEAERAAVQAERAAAQTERAAVTGEEAATRARLFAKTSEVASDLLPAGAGRTDKFGNVVYSTLGSPNDIALVRYHESVHSLLSPKLNLLREFRANIGVAAYQRSSLVKYLEEALSETYAQLRVAGFKGLPTGIAFPVKEGYVTLRAVVTEGAIATIGVGGTTYGVYYAASK
jgi:hypothetical protein